MSTTENETQVVNPDFMDAFNEMDDSELDAAIAGSRLRGIYDEKILGFIDSGRRGVEVNLGSGTHEGKKAASVKTGYESARERLVGGKVENATDEQKAAAEKTRVILKGDRVFLVRSDVAATAAA